MWCEKLWKINWGLDILIRLWTRCRLFFRLGVFRSVWFRHQTNSSFLVAHDRFRSLTRRFIFFLGYTTNTCSCRPFAYIHLALIYIYIRKYCLGKNQCKLGNSIIAEQRASTLRDQTRACTANGAGIERERKLHTYIYTVNGVRWRSRSRRFHGEEKNGKGRPSLLPFDRQISTCDWQVYRLRHIYVQTSISPPPPSPIQPLLISTVLSCVPLELFFPKPQAFLARCPYFQAGSKKSAVVAINIEQPGNIYVSWQFPGKIQTPSFLVSRNSRCFSSPLRHARGKKLIEVKS